MEVFLVVLPEVVGGSSRGVSEYAAVITEPVDVVRGTKDVIMFPCEEASPYREEVVAPGPADFHYRTASGSARGVELRVGVVCGADGVPAVSALVLPLGDRVRSLHGARHGGVEPDERVE